MLDDEENSLFGGASDIDDDDLEKKKDVKSSGTIDGDKKNLFRKELRAMLYGFGDDKVPYNETLELLEEIVVEYVRDMTLLAMDVGKPGKVTLEDIHYLIRRDPKKYGRVKDLLSMSEELRKARKAFEQAKDI